MRLSGGAASSSWPRPSRPSRRRGRCGSGAARCPPPTARSRRRRSSSAGSSSSRPRTSTRPARWRPGSRPRASGASRCGRSRSSSTPSRAALQDMSEDPVERAREMVDGVYRQDSRRVLATPIRPLGDFHIPEEALHAAFSAAVGQRPRDGTTPHPRAARMPYEVPSRVELPDRLDAVLHVVYLVFNEGYSASSGESLTRADLSGEAIRLGRLLVELLPEPEAMGLLALMLLHESRRAAPPRPTREPIPLDDPERPPSGRGQHPPGTRPGCAGRA